MVEFSSWAHFRRSTAILPTNIGPLIRLRSIFQKQMTRIEQTLIMRNHFNYYQSVDNGLTYLIGTLPLGGTQVTAAVAEAIPFTAICFRNSSNQSRPEKIWRTHI